MASLREHPWERAAGPAPGAASSSHPWERQSSSASDSDGEHDPESNAGAAAMMFLDVMVGMYTSSAVSAQTFCTLCYWAGNAGMPRLVNDYGLRPGLQTGKYQAHLNKRMGFDEQ